MDFEFDDFGAAVATVARSVLEPTVPLPTSVPAAQVTPVTPTTFSVVMALHGPDYKPVYEPTSPHPRRYPAQTHAIVGQSVDLRG
jgi:hypothetical protein